MTTDLSTDFENYLALVKATQTDGHQRECKFPKVRYWLDKKKMSSKLCLPGPSAMPDGVKRATLT